MEKILLAGVIGTTAMTLFSYIISEVSNRLFKEPVLLAGVLTGLHFKSDKESKHILGWLLHYAIGCVFSSGYYLLLRFQILQITIGDAMVFGVAIGILGIVGWRLLFKIGIYKPKNKMTSLGYYLQLFFAHVLFALAVFGFYYSHPH